MTRFYGRSVEWMDGVGRVAESVSCVYILNTHNSKGGGLVVIPRARTWWLIVCRALGLADLQR